MASILDLPAEITEEMCKYLSFVDLQRIVKTSHKLRADCLALYEKRRLQLPLAALLYCLITRSDVRYQRSSIEVDINIYTDEYPPELKDAGIADIIEASDTWDQIKLGIGLSIKYDLQPEMTKFLNFLHDKLDEDEYNEAWISIEPGNALTQHFGDTSASMSYGINDVKSVREWIPILLPLVDQRLLIENKYLRHVAEEYVNHLSEDIS